MPVSSCRRGKGGQSWSRHRLAVGLDAVAGLARDLGRGDENANPHSRAGAGSGRGKTHADRLHNNSAVRCPDVRLGVW